MAMETDHTLPGKAGLFFSCEALNEAGWQQEHKARQSLERWCHSCGLSACYGFSVTFKDDGVCACSDASCRSSAEVEIAQRLCPSPLAKPSDETAAPTLDLFGKAA
jgi:hypothetical protein